MRMPRQEKATATMDSTSDQSRYFRGSSSQPGQGKGDVGNKPSAPHQSLTHAILALAKSRRLPGPRPLTLHHILHRDSSLRFLLITLHNLVTVCPSITAGGGEKEDEPVKTVYVSREY
ncbi:hypothetical protein EYF80_024074 [Liparis tanakae]|uniref:Uncharacterized protein n=1 Tax=Liparis tanakae TaxID=230148 RepID=A0A4Z2HJB9_9TELE|nr:hypothetical protein EYF80_024074 [Liparis tanakae]